LKKLTLYKIGSDYNPLVRTFAIFLMIISVLMFINSFAIVFDSWQTVRDFDVCAADSRVEDNRYFQTSVEEKLLSEMRFAHCTESLNEITGTQLPPNQTFLTTRQKITALTYPVAILFIWAAIFLFSINLYLSASFVLPIEETQIALRPFKEIKENITKEPIRNFKKKK
jgi:hypothetical protein